MRHSRSGEASLIRLRARNDTGPEAIIARQRLLLVDLRPRGGEAGNPGSFILYAHYDRVRRKRGVEPSKDGWRVVKHLRYDQSHGAYYDQVSLLI